MELILPLLLQWNVKAVNIHLFIDCIDRPAMAVTVSDSSRSLLMACMAENPIVCSIRFSTGQ